MKRQPAYVYVILAGVAAAIVAGANIFYNGYRSAPGEFINRFWN
jgi:hypothetical protein